MPQDYLPHSTFPILHQSHLVLSNRTQEDLDIQVHGSSLPNLGPNFHSPEALLDAVDYYIHANALTVNGARPLNWYFAHMLPLDPEQWMIRRQIKRFSEEIQTAHPQEMSNGFGDLPDLGQSTYIRKPTFFLGELDK
ncbi:hypothetical protein L210DRAFT_984740 [Boletus edulis BED1]|uniref:Uncharacterized protein n=1 Tax=Boletus edulis BED1 TaxID=1328754 RepID=A0AAD4G9N6_BOLED|nr:hypothetical protein L210DRAFT_984740 [Boletus edulis BED1]